jgi:hypothetical protein
MTKQSSMNRRNRRMNKRNRGEAAIPHPPQIKSYGITHDVRLRFQSGSAINTTITYHNLLDAINVATSATTANTLFTQVRVNAVEMWATPVTGAPATVSLIYSGLTVGAAGDQKLHTDTSVGIEPAHVKASPDRRTQAGQFQVYNTDVAFALVCPANTVIDVSMSYRNAVLGVTNVVQSAPVGATVGALYYRGLDGAAASTTTMPVVGALATD